MTRLKIEMNLLLANRAKLAKIMRDLSVEKMTHIPKGFNNNILWHIGHCVVSQQRLVYLNSGLPVNISEAYHDNFKIGTSPNNWKQLPDLVEIETSLLSTAEQLKTDLDKGLFKTYKSFVTSMGVEISNTLDAVTYSNFHEAGHTANIQYLIRIMNEGS